ncbi:hypothetical protein K2Z83_16140, partial [Oscillochloris sp. ZM17-4]|uniref:DUF5666 domain-containing protein n=1 Tax=Oscillochloris sp. ZM17-4 TaxID=2866714 RepID=UPI001C72D33F
MDTELELKLILCLDALDAGEPLDDVLARYPAEADTLRPFLETAVALPRLALEPTPSAQVSSRRAFLNRAADLRPTAGRRFFGLPLRLGVALATILLALALAGGGTAAASAALPGEPLYGLKRVAEQVQVALSADKAYVEQEIAQRRRDEVGALIAQDRSAEVGFGGQVTAISADTWQIAGYAVQVDASTQIDGDIRPGAAVTVVGRLVGGVIRATAILADPDVNPVPVALPTPVPTATASQTPAPTASQTPAPTASQTPAPTATAVPPTAPAPSPTAVPPTATLRPVRPAPTAVLPTISPPTAGPAEDHGGGGDTGEKQPTAGPAEDHGGGGDTGEKQPT